MHFSKTYSELLLKLPPELRENAVEYRRLKKLIKQVVEELTSIGLSPDVLHKVLLEPRTDDASTKGKEREKGAEWVEIGSSEDAAGLPKVVYEINHASDHFEPRLRVIVSTADDNPVSFPSFPTTSHVEPALDDEQDGASDEGRLEVPSTSRGRDSGHTDGRRSHSTSPEPLSMTTHGDTQEVVISLPSDSVFFDVLMHTSQSLSVHLADVQKGFMGNLEELARNVSASARPMSSVAPGDFEAYSRAANPASVSVRTPSSSALIGRARSDLYSWRELFQMYVDTEVFESHSERTRGERSIEEAEERMSLFLQRLEQAGFFTNQKMRLPESKAALQSFLHLNTFIIDLKKFQFATSEATRKILKKHAKRTALPVDPGLTSRFFAPVPSVTLDSSPATSLVRYSHVTEPGTPLSLSLVQAVGEVLLPIIPHIDDYACVICMSIAFKPIRLGCGHLFCVRCLVKMQKRGQDHCPMCRASTVLAANRTNVDWALLNFMKDWFPVEAKKKLQQNEREATEEQVEELRIGFKEPSCIIA